MRAARIIWFSLILIGLSILGLICWFCTTNYSYLIRFTTAQLGRPDLKTILEKTYFSIDKFNTVQFSLKIITPLLLLANLFLILKRKEIIKYIDGYVDYLNEKISNWKRSISNASRSTKIVLYGLLMLITIRSVYFAIYFYPQYDECWNYNYFLSNHVLTTVVAYNNYPLHNIISLFFIKLLPDSAFVMRLPSILFGLINMLFVYSIFQKLFQNEKIALASVAIFAILPTSVFYMLFARGVMIALFFSLIFLYYFFLRKPTYWNRMDIVNLGTCGALGSYSMTSFPILVILFAFLYGTQYLIQQDWNSFKKIMAAFLMSGILTILFYTPMLLGSGMDLGMTSKYSTAHFSFQTIIDKAEFISRNQIGFYKASYFFIAINLILLFIYRRKEIISFNLLLLILPFLIPLLFHTFFPARAICFQVLAYLFTLVIILEQILNRFKTSIFIVSCLAIVLSGNYISTHHTFFDWSARPDKAAAAMATVLQEQHITSYYDMSGAFQYFVPGILYYYKLKNKEIQFYTVDKNSTRYAPKIEFTGDCFIDRKQNILANNKKVLYEYEDFIIYRLSDSNHLNAAHETQPPQ